MESDDGKLLDTIIFDTIVPLPYRILFLIQLGHLLWYLIVYISYKINGLNVLALINLSYSSHNYPQLDQYTQFGDEPTVNQADIKENELLLKGVWFNLRVISINTFISYVIFKAIQIIFNEEEHHRSLILIYHLIPLITILVISYKIFTKNSTDNSVGKLRIFTTMKRILVGNINSRFMRTNDILISDSLMSYSKVLNDIGIFIWHYFISDELKYNNILELTVLSLPSMIRIRQCWNEFSLTGQKTHFLNLIKYATGLLPIFINFLIKFNIEQYGADEDTADKEGHLASLHALGLWWYGASFISSTYSFTWDVKMDWDFHMFDRIFGSTPKSTPLLRTDDKLLHADKKYIYYTCIGIDFVLRFIWVLKFLIIENNENLPIINKIGLMLFGYDAFSFGYCLVEVLEIVRRFMWCFFKLENDWFKLQIRGQDIELSKMG